MSSSTVRVLLTVALSAIVMIVWYQYFAPPAPKAPQHRAAPGKEERAEKERGSLQQDTGEKPSGNKERLVEQGPPRSRKSAARAEALLTTFDTKHFSATFTNIGASMRHWVLKDPRFRETWNGKLVQVDLVKTSQGPWPLQIAFPDAQFTIPDDAAFSLVKKTSREVSYFWQSEEVALFKSYLLDPKRSIVWMTVKLKNLSERQLKGRMEISLFNQQDPTQEKASFTNPYPKIGTVLCYANGELDRRSAGAISGSESGCSAAGCGMGEGPVSKTGEIFWTGMDDRYFLAAVVPLDKLEQRRCELKLLENGIIQSSILFPEQTLGPGQTTSKTFSIYAGPKDLSRMDAIKGAGGSEINLGEAIEFGWFAFLCRPMLWLLKLFYSLLGNWGVAIILLTVIVKLLTFYWAQKSMNSMKEMQRLKPKMDALKEKYQNDKQRLNQEIMSLYKIHKVNPLGGCLPMLIQMPIWFALYRTLGNAVELYRSNFAGWITDLTAPDPYYILPVAMGIAMYGQQAISPQPMDGAQAKMMKYFMPGMFTVMMLALPSGLTLYIFVNTILTMVQQWYNNKKAPLPEKAVSMPAEPKGQEASHRKERTRGGVQRGRQRKRNRTRTQNP